MEKKDNTHAFDAGTHATFRHGGFHAGATALYTHFNRELLPLTTPLYRRHYANGNDFINLSADYGYQNHLIAFSGETATNRDGALATINSLNLRAADGVNLMLLQRFYSYRYTALYARSLTEGGHVQNESAVYLGASWQPSPNLRLQAYTDYAYFAWPRYGVSQSSHAWDNLLMATYSQARWRLAGRYRLHLRQKDDNKKTSLVNQTEHRGRLLLSWNNGRGLTCATQADAVGTYTEKYETGYMISESVGYKWRNTRLNYHVGYFHTDSYDARLYVF